MKNLTLTLGTKRSAPTSRPHRYAKRCGRALTDAPGRRERRSYVGRAFRRLAAVGLSLATPSLWAQQSQSAAGSPGAAWSAIQQLVQNLESAVQSKNLHGIHEPSMKIRTPIRALKQHCSMLGPDTSQKMVAALKQLDNAITDLHSAADAGNQKDAESALKEVETAFDQLKSLDPETAFKSTR